MSEELKNKLKAAREALDLSQSQMAARLGVKVQTLQSWEANRYTPSALALEALERKLDELLNNTSN